LFSWTFNRFVVFKAFTKIHSLLSDQFFDPFHFACKRRIFDTRVKPPGRFHYGFCMCKPVKGMFAMIGTHAAVSNAPERKMMVGQVP